MSTLDVHLVFNFEWDVCFPDVTTTTAVETTTIDSREGCTDEITTENTGSYDTILDLTLGSSKAIKFSDYSRACNKRDCFLFEMFELQMMPMWDFSLVHHITEYVAVIKYSIL